MSRSQERREREQRIALAELTARRIVRDVRRWPEWKIRGCYGGKESDDRILAERAAWLETPAGERYLELSAEMDRLIDEP